MTSHSPTSSDPRPTRGRYWVVLFAVTLSVITYVHRVSISQAAPLMMEELGLTKVQFSWAFSMFSLGYFLFQIPGGWLSDWIGPRRVLASIVTDWSFFTAATGWVWNVVSLSAARLFCGLGQGGVFPVMTKMLSAWLPSNEHVRAQGLMWLSARWGGAASPLLVVFMLQYVSWRRTFELLALLGFIWTLLFWRWFRDSPRGHRNVNAAEMELLAGAEEKASGHGDVPWGRFFRSPTVWLLCAQYGGLSYGFYFYITWLPTYIQEARGQSMEQSAWLAGIPLFCAGIGSISCGFLLRKIEGWFGDVGRARRFMGGLGCFGSGAGLIVSLQIEEPFWAMVAMGAAAFSTDLAMPPSWGACMDVGGKYAGSLSGTMNTAGNIAGFFAPITIAKILEVTGGNWPITFFLSAGIYFTGVFCWIFIDPVTPLDRDQSQAARTG
ncbi:MAG: MFS transporter [Bryobacterales bacterium]|nr:MFS transporter [Bryobacterales bacterium]